jgi:hypothetical protein
MLERQRLTRKRLSSNREKLKQYCGQLNLERIPEHPSPPSPRDQAQILLDSYRGTSHDKAMYKQYNVQHTAFQVAGRESSYLTSGHGSIDPSPKAAKRSREKTAEEIIDRLREKKMRELMGIPLPSSMLHQLDIKSTNTLQDVVAIDSDEGGFSANPETVRKKVKLVSNPVMIQNFKYSPR